MLSDLFNKYGCDKSKKHKYHTVYEPDFEQHRDEPLSLLEVGVFRGESLKAWVDYFPNATIYGIDIFTRVVPENVDILKHPRVKWAKIDSLDATATATLGNIWPGVVFDFIIDDGLHTPVANAKTLQNLWKYLRPDGKYYIEDVWPIDIMSSGEMMHKWVRLHPNDYNQFEMDKFLKTVAIHSSNTSRYDLRDLTGEPDSHIFRLIK